MKRFFATVSLIAIGLFGTGCHMHGLHGVGFHVPVAPVVHAAAHVAVAAAVVGTAVALSVPHDAHVHWDNCGCQRRWHEGRWVYWYGGWWEFSDPSTGYWYHY